jgi:hypothetical protein
MVLCRNFKRLSTGHPEWKMLYQYGTIFNGYRAGKLTWSEYDKRVHYNKIWHLKDVHYFTCSGLSMLLQMPKMSYALSSATHSYPLNSRTCKMTKCLGHWSAWPHRQCEVCPLCIHKYDLSCTPAQGTQEGFGPVIAVTNSMEPLRPIQRPGTGWSTYCVACRCVRAPGPPSQCTLTQWHPHTSAGNPFLLAHDSTTAENCTRINT